MSLAGFYTHLNLKVSQLPTAALLYVLQGSGGVLVHQSGRVSRSRSMHIPAVPHQRLLYVI